MIKNMRDLGGIKTSDGMTVRHGCLIRSGNLHNATPEELEGVSEIIDFRTNLEEEKMPDMIPKGKSYRRIPIFNESAAGITREGNISEVPDVKKLYRAMLTEESYRLQLQEIMRVILTHDYTTGALLWHYTAGKDRCGIVTALVLTVLGTNRDSIMKDYLRSNEDCISESDEVYQRLVTMGMVEAIFSCDIAPGKKCMDTITFLRSDLTENGITDINEADLYFHIFSAETWNEIVDTQPIKLTF